MKKTAIVLAILLIAASCGPVPYYIDVDVRRDADYKIELSDKTVAIIAVNALSDRDSALVSEVGMGIAERVEEEKGIENGSIPVFSVASDNFSIDEAGELDLVGVETSSDIIFTIDSLTIGQYDVSASDVNSSIVKLPFTFDFGIYDMRSLSFVRKISVKDTIEWNLLSESSITRAKAVATANNVLVSAFRETGRDFASQLFGQWETQHRMLVSYSGREWSRGDEAALNFKWQEAIESWLKLVYSDNNIKASCAAYNISIACEMQEDYDLSLKWLDFAEEKYPFREITLQREHILKLKEKNK